MTVDQLMRSHVVLLAESASVLDAAQQMRAAALGDVVVMRDGRLCGIVTERDLVVRCLARRYDPSTLTLGELCDDEPFFLAPHMATREAARLMRERGLARVPVVDQGRVVGVLTLADARAAGH